MFVLCSKTSDFFGLNAADSLWRDKKMVTKARCCSRVFYILCVDKELDRIFACAPFSLFCVLNFNEKMKACFTPSKRDFSKSLFSKKTTELRQKMLFFKAICPARCIALKLKKEGRSNWRLKWLHDHSLSINHKNPCSQPPTRLAGNRKTS